MKYVEIMWNMLTWVMILLGVVYFIAGCPKAEAADNYETQAFNMALNYADMNWPDYEFVNRSMEHVDVWYSWDAPCGNPRAVACYIPMFQTIMMPRRYHPRILMHEYLHHILFINMHPLAGSYHLPRIHHENMHLRNGLAGRRIH